MPYQAIDFSHLLGLDGFSDNALNTHFKLYQGYVANTNKVAEALKKMNEAGQAGTPEFAELKRRFGWEFNGMRLHEYYFGAMTKEEKKLSEDSLLYKKMVEEFGSDQACHDDFRATAMLRGIGWTILYYDSQEDRLFNTWVNEHDLGHLAGQTILVNADVFEHAFMLDYGTNKGNYVDAYIKAIDWEVVEKRFLEAKK